MVKMDWNEETQEMYDDFINRFGMKYIIQEAQLFNELLDNRPNEINADYLNKIKTIDSIKLNTFRNLGFENFDKILDDLEEKKNDALLVYGKGLFDKKFDRIKDNVEKLNNSKITRNKKKSIVETFEALVDEFAYLKNSYYNELTELHKLISKLKIID